MPKSSNHIIYNILAKKFSGQATEEECRIFDEWLETAEDARETLYELNNIWAEELSPQPTELVSQREINEKIWQQAFENKKSQFNLAFIWKVAAVLLVLLTTISIVYFAIVNPLETIHEITTIQKHTLPGQKSMVTLQDGTVVWLNSGSKLSYQSDYNENIREVVLEGQAYFEVFKDKTKPFIVKCRNLEVEALGTSFDVNAYQQSPIQVSLLTGSVKLSVSDSGSRDEMILSPGEFSTLSQQNKFSKKQKFDPYDVLAWKEGRLIFKLSTLDQIIPKLEMWYGVKIENELERNLEKHFNGTFERENLENILHNMGLAMGFEYEFQGNKVIIKNNMPM